MSIAIISGSAGLVGSEAAAHFAARGLQIVGIDNDSRRIFFGDEASTAANRRRLEASLGRAYRHVDVDIRDDAAMRKLFGHYGRDIALVVHCAAQPSHDWAAREPLTDFTINAMGTAVLLEATRQSAPDAAFIFTSTNKVYGDTPNRLPFVELDTRWEVEPGHRFETGIDESMSIDGSLHSVFGASKVAADVLVQEYGRYFGLRTATFRGGCLTGPRHAGAELHGFLAYLVRCAVTGRPYRVIGYKGKQVRDNIHSVDLVRAFDRFFDAPRVAAVYNIGGGRRSNCSILEAMTLIEELTGRVVQWAYSETPRIGDHQWWISDVSKFETDYPGWHVERDVRDILEEIYAENSAGWLRSVRGEGAGIP
jgi:CDP-paratose 2-epimerase